MLEPRAHSFSRGEEEKECGRVGGEAQGRRGERSCAAAVELGAESVALSLSCLLAPPRARAAKRKRELMRPLLRGVMRRGTLIRDLDSLADERVAPRADYAFSMPV